MCWQYSKSISKTKEELDRLWRYISDPAFDPLQKPGFSHDREYRRVMKYLDDDSNPFRAEHGWMQDSVMMPLIKEGKKFTENDPDIPFISIDNVFHRSILDIMKSVFADNVSSSFHFTPFTQYWTTADGRRVRVYSEAYMSPRTLKVDEEVNLLPRNADDQYERVVVPIMLWSDATQLANFGNASLWPIYLYFGNQSKYIRGKPTSGACHHLAYIPSVSFTTVAIQ
ncbi:hypothetical protein EV363DRAFT_1169188 [Boletus edulis]|nr:hypothetical protein EV363DRAFT_1200997 [Boletus edulis]KAF8129184.1 hypothetical protein EV363DRAFT_1169188 [Boletus edulis]